MPLKRDIDCLIRERQGDVSREGSAFGFCCLLYGSSESPHILANTLAMAHSLRDRRHPLLLLITEDVPHHYAGLLAATSLFDKILVVDYLLGHETLFKKNWFREVFTKLHIFNMTDFEKVIFLDLDIIVNDVGRLEDLFQADYLFAAMENSKGEKAGSMWLRHGERMGRNCRLINAGVMMVTPDSDLFELLVSDILSASPDHVPGMTPEQFYLARVMGSHFHHLSQEYNFEVQFHGGVPLTNTWKTQTTVQDIVCFHFSGGNPVQTLSSWDAGEHITWGCQTEKYFVRKAWENDFSEETRNIANTRALKAFKKWAFHYMHACDRIPDHFPLNGLRDIFQRVKSIAARFCDQAPDCFPPVYQHALGKKPTRLPPSLECES